MKTFECEKKPLDLKDWAYETIKHLILTFDIEPGEQLRIEDLSKQMKVSRTPIREALLRLEGEDLVEAASRVGFFVKGISEKDLRELFELREITESFAAKKAALLLTDIDLAWINRLQEEAVSAVEKNDLNEFNEKEIALHTFILEKSQNQRLLKLVESIKDLTYRQRLLSLKSIDNVKKSLTEHQDIITALQNKNSKSAGELMSDHICAVKNRIQKILDIPE
ncbi:MAG: GntR family transcriptional regulator [Desulfobacterales bacterium]|nr:GntR family transcriptional regulator [Desulfobacterales bacterium]